MRLLSRSVFLAALSLAAFDAQAKRFTLMSANVENFFDVDGVSPYEDYQQDTPEKKIERPYTARHLCTKIQNFAKVLARFQDGQGPDVVALNEIEVDHTPESTIKGTVDPSVRPAYTDADWEEFFKKLEGKKLEEWLGGELTPEQKGYPSEAWLLKGLRDAGLPPYHIAYVTHTKAEMDKGPAVKNILLTRYPILEVKGHKLESARDLLEVKLDVQGQPMTVIVNHWKSGADSLETEAVRIQNATVTRAVLDGILKADPHADVVLAGDLNSQYNQKAVVKGIEKSAINDVLKAQGDETALQRPGEADLYNLWFELPVMKRGSDVYRGYWGTLMHLIVTPGLYDNKGVQYVDNSFRVAAFEDLNLDPMLGEPRRFSRLTPEGSGFSDHLPVVADFDVTDKNSPDTFIKLVSPSKDAKLPERGRRVDYANLKRDLVPDAVKVLGELTVQQLDEHMGKVFYVTGTVLGQKPPRVKVGNNEYEIYCFDKDVMAGVNAMKEGRQIRLYGELGEYKGRRQFNIRHASWMISDR